MGHEGFGSSQVRLVILGDTSGHGSVEVACEFVLERIFTKEDVSSEEVSCHGVFWASNNGLNGLQFSSA
jgi:hypothetical protein